MIDSILKDFNPQNKELILVALQTLTQHGQLDQEAFQKVANYFNVSPAKVYAVGSFYSFIPLEQKGKYVIRICKSISCDMEHKEEVIAAIKQFLGIDVGQTTNDKMFSITEVNCLGWCDEAPVMIINDIPYTKLTKEKAIAILTELKNKQI
ncbi:MAG: NAD(P)H-dependent oxidoreductase subunit E [Spirochaetes bacterium]|nr:NAD(P)H-dependent oxidoreductase subunit E [Spirochaetota bacterium]